MKLKETLNLGKTAFPMRAGLPTREPEWQKAWDEANLYVRRQELNEGKPSFHLHDGPPYANGNIHVGHALNKVSKDYFIKNGINLSTNSKNPVDNSKIFKIDIDDKKVIGHFV